MKIHLKNGERVRTPKKNNNQIRNNKDNVKKRTPKKERRRTSKKERRRTFRKKRNQIYIKRGGMEIDDKELSEILKGEDLEDLKDLNEEEIEKIKEIILKKEDKDYDKIMEELDTLNISNPKKIVEILNIKNEEKGKLNTDIDGRFAQLKESESEFDENKRMLLNANNKEKKLSDDEIDHVTGLKDKFMTKLLNKKGETDINIIKRIFRKLSVRKLINMEAEDEDDQTLSGGGEVYYYYLNIDSNRLNELFNNISRSNDDKNVENILKGLNDREEEERKLKEDLIHIFNSSSDNKKIFKIPPFFIEKFIEIAIDTRNGAKYEKEHLENLKSIIGYDEKDEQLEELDDKLKASKKNIEDEYKYLTETRETINKLTEEVSGLEAEVTQLENAKDDMRNEQELKETRKKIITKTLKIELANMKVRKAKQALDAEQKKKEEEELALKAAAEAQARAEEEERVSELARNIDAIMEQYVLIRKNISPIQTEFEERGKQEGREDYSKIVSEYEEINGKIEGVDSSFQGINQLPDIGNDDVDKYPKYNSVKEEYDVLKKDIIKLKKEINAALVKAIEVDKQNLKDKSIYELDFYHDNLQSLDREFYDKKYDEFYELFLNKRGGQYDQSVQMLAQAQSDEWAPPGESGNEKGKINRIKEKILRPFHKHISMILKLPFIRKLNGLSKSDIESLKDKPFIVDRKYIGEEFYTLSTEEGGEGVWKKWLNYIFDYLFVSPEVILSSSIIKDDKGEDLKKQLNMFNQNSSENSIRDTKIFSIDLLYEPPDNFQGKDPKAFHVKTLLNMVDELLKAESFVTESNKEKILILLPIIYNKYYYSRLNVKFENVIDNLERHAPNKSILDGLNEKIKANVGNNIVTYLKIRINNNSEVEPRFNFTFKGIDKRMRNKVAEELVLANVDPIKTLYLKYNADQDKVEDEDWHSSSFKPSANPRLHYNYTFGKFTEVFTSQHQPKEIAKKMSMDGGKTSALLNHIIEGKPIFILGYGASGAGKTSTLINYVPDDPSERSTPGILIELCNNLGGMGYDKVTVKSKEYFAGINEDKENTPEGVEPIDDLPDTYEKGLKLFNASVDTVNFEWKVRQFLLKKNEEYTNMFHKSRFDMHQVKSSQGQSNCPEVSDDEGNSCDQPGSWPEFKEKVFKTQNEQVELGSFIEFLVDKDRFVKATTNNPQSSRSHTLVYIELVNTEKSISNKQLIEGSSGLDLEQDQMEIIKGKINKKISNFNEDITEVEVKLINIINTFIYETPPEERNGFPGDNGEKTIPKLKKVGSPTETLIHIWYNSEGLEANTKEKGKELIENIKKYQKLIRDLDNYENSYSSEIPQKKAHLFVGDFAGVENAFQCNNVNVVKKMLGAAKGKVPFYSMNINAKGQQGGSLIPPAGKEMVKYDPTFSVIHDDKNNDLDITFIPRKKNEYALEFIDFGGPRALENFYKYSKYYDLPKLTKKEKEKGEESHFNAVPEFKFKSIKPIHYIIKKTLGIEGSDTNINDKIYTTIYEEIKRQGADKYYEEIVKKLKEQKIELEKDLKRLNTTTGSLIQELKQKPDMFGFDSKAIFFNDNKLVWPPSVKDEPGGAVESEKAAGDRSALVQKKIRNYYKDKYISSDEDIEIMFKKIRDTEDPAALAGGDTEYIYLVSDFMANAKFSTKKAYRSLYGSVIKAHKRLAPMEAMHEFIARDKRITGEIFKTINASVILQNIKEIEKKNAQNFTGGDKPYMEKLFNGAQDFLPNLTEIKEPDNYEYNYNIINRILKTIIKRLAFGNKICNNRLTEGKYINQSLANVRNTINDIVSYKNRETILAVPDIEDNCLEQYKNGCGENCFSLTQKTIKGDHVIDSEIFKDIKNFIRISNCMETYNTNDFYDDILVSVFCVANFTGSVFDNSGGAPPTPHIDLNEIYTAFYNYGGLLPGRERESEVRSQFEDTDNNLRNALSNLLSKINYYIKEENPKIDNFFDIDDVPEPFKLREGDDYNSIKERVNKSNDVELQMMKIQLETLRDRIGILEKIENSNAVTTIGTLEFIDKISKYQLTNTICIDDSSETGGE